MTKDLFIGLLISVTLHAAFLFGEKLFPEGEVTAVAEAEEEFTIEMMEMPPLEPEPEDIIDVTDETYLQELLMVLCTKILMMVQIYQKNFIVVF